ncbi:hypothetical protein B9Z55_021873 [Caenorhabditis nigoni]|uniref:Uncharacterized protein n=1 Tax=Caenorhabditis nigoni TaxID=1611254 RepID=A0A2G5TU15_9PELO|nr:hypothetical protein B9Z55_021873 [Caenorhabditis nigoni]
MKNILFQRLLAFTSSGAVSYFQKVAPGDTWKLKEDNFNSEELRIVISRRRCSEYEITVTSIGRVITFGPEAQSEMHLHGWRCDLGTRCNKRVEERIFENVFFNNGKQQRGRGRPRKEANNEEESELQDCFVCPGCKPPAGLTGDKDSTDYRCGWCLCWYHEEHTTWTESPKYKGQYWCGNCDKLPDVDGSRKLRKRKANEPTRRSAQIRAYDNLSKYSAKRRKEEDDDEEEKSTPKRRNVSLID